MSEVIVTREMLTSALVMFITKYSNNSSLNSTKLLIVLNNLEEFEDTNVIILDYDTTTTLTDILDKAHIDLFSRPDRLTAIVDGPYIKVIKDETNTELVKILNDKLIGYRATS